MRRYIILFPIVMSAIGLAVILYYGFLEVRAKTLTEKVVAGDSLSVTIHTDNPYEDDLVLSGTVTGRDGDYVQYVRGGSGDTASLNLRRCYQQGKDIEVAIIKNQ